MDRLRRALLVVLVASLVAVGACSDDDDGAVPPADPLPEHGPTSVAPDSAGLDIPEVPGTFPVPLKDLGIGFRVPNGWQATVLTEAGLERLAEADLAQPSFLEAARNVADSGAVFYAAGVDDEGRVSELKVDVQDGADTSADGLAAVAQAVVDSGQVEDATVVGGGDGRVRVDYRLTLDAADHSGAIEAYGSQLFVADGDRLWSLIVTSEDEQSQDALLTIFDRTIVFD